MSSTPSLPDPAPLEPSAETAGTPVPAPQADAAQPAAEAAGEMPADAAADETAADDAPVQPEAGKPASAAAMTPAECAQALKSRFPALFSGSPKPLKLRIQADIQARAPGVFTRQVLSSFLRRHTGSTSYLIALSRAKTRFDLDGQPADELSDEHRQAAVDELARRRGITQQRREVEDQQRRDRFNLLRDFERTTLTEPNFCALKGMTTEQLHATLAQARQELIEAPPQREFDPRRPPREGGQPREDRRPGGGGPRGPGGPNIGEGRGPRREGGGRDGGREDRPQGDRPPRREGGGPRRDGAQAKGPRNSGPRRHDDRPQRPQGNPAGKTPGEGGGQQG